MFGALSKQITSLVIAASSLFSSHLTPVFENCTYSLQNDVLMFSARITNCYNKEIEQVLQSGQQIQLEFRYQIFEQGDKMPLHANSEFHLLSYDVVDKFYTIDNTELGYSSIFEDFEEAKDYFILLRDLQIQHIDFFQEGRQYYFEISATLHPVYLAEMEKNIELMKYWKNKSPTYRSPAFTLKDLES